MTRQRSQLGDNDKVIFDAKIRSTESHPSLLKLTAKLITKEEVRLSGGYGGGAFELDVDASEVFGFLAPA